MTKEERGTRTEIIKMLDGLNGYYTDMAYKTIMNCHRAQQNEEIEKRINGNAQIVNFISEHHGGMRK